MPRRELSLGRSRPAPDDGSAPGALSLPPHHLVTHGVVVGMTGSGKTGLVMVLVEEALRSGVPVLMIDVKGDLPNLLLSFPGLSPAEFEPWVDADAAARDGKTPSAVAEGLAHKWQEGLAGWGLGAADVAALRSSIAPRILTPGTTAGEPLHVLSSLEGRSALWDDDEEAAREALSAAVSLLLRLVERDADPARSREHVVLSLLAERRQRSGAASGLAELLADLARPPVATVGAMPMDEFLPPKERLALAQELNALLASPTFASWRQGAALDVAEWLRPRDGKTPVVVLSVAHLDDSERMLVLGLVLEQLLSYVRGLPGTSDLRALVLFDELYGFLPPHPANPPSKRPLLALLKQARAFGVGLILATQNPMDLDYKALSNAGLWFVGRLQTDADRERVVEGLVGSDSGGGGLDAGGLGDRLKALPPRTFFVRDVHRSPSTFFLETRWTLSWLRGPMTRREIGRLYRALGAPAPAAVAPVAPVEAAAALAAPAPMAAVAPAAGVAPSAPAAPDGWRTFHGYPPAAPPDRWTYVPHVAFTAIAHVRDTKLGVQRNVTRTLAVPLLEGGRVDPLQAAPVDRTNLEAPPVPGARYQPLPEALAKKKTLQALEKSLRDHVYRSVEVTLDLHRELGLVREDYEAAEGFVARCAVEAARVVAAAQQSIAAAHAPKIARLTERLQAAQAAVAQAQAAASAAPGTVGAVLVGVMAGARAGQRLQSQQQKALDRLGKAQAELADAESALREAIRGRDAEIAAEGTRVQRVAEGIESRRLAPKKGDVELAEIGIAWAAR